MISKEDYKNLKIGDSVLVSGIKGTIFHFEEEVGGQKVPVVVLEEKSNFGVSASGSNSTLFQKRLEAQLKAGYSADRKSYRLFENNIDKIVFKCSDSTSSTLPLKREELTCLFIGDVVTIDDVDHVIQTNELNGLKTPWIKSINKSDGVYPCAGDCHSGNKKLNVEYDQKYQSLLDILRTKNIYLKKFAQPKPENDLKIKQEETSVLKEEIMIEENKTKFVEIVKSDAQEAAYRTAAKKGVRMLRAAILKVAKSKGVETKEINYLRKAFESELGESILSMALGYILTYAPLPGNVKNNRHFSKIVGELRINGLQIGMDVLLTEAMEYVGPALDEIRSLLPDSEEEISVIPARIAKPTSNKRIKAPKEESSDSEISEEVSEKSQKKNNL